MKLTVLNVFFIIGDSSDINVLFTILFKGSSKDQIKTSYCFKKCQDYKTQAYLHKSI